MKPETTHEVKPTVSKVGESMFIEFRCEEGFRFIDAETIVEIRTNYLGKAVIVGRFVESIFPTIHTYAEAMDSLKAALGKE